MTSRSVVLLTSLLLCVFGCGKNESQPAVTEVPPVLNESWKYYVQRFVQEDGRVIDHSAEGISTSEGQAYAMLRAVWIGDRATFDKALSWARNNLNAGIRSDSLWAWKWGKNAQGQWGVLDKAFASDADQDAALALILAARVWNEPQYAERARFILRDLWRLGTMEAGGRRYLLAGDTLCSRTTCRINPSYYAPYAYRIFAAFDVDTDWNRLVDGAYDLLTTVSRFSMTGLPPDWVELNTETGEVKPGSDKDTVYSYDAFRVHWRIAADRDLFREPRADAYLRQSLAWVAAEWEKHQKLPAVISPAGKHLADYESLEMLSALMCALRNESMHKRVAASYSQGLWGGDSSRYYVQNWAWFGTALYSGYLGPFELVRR